MEECTILAITTDRLQNSENNMNLQTLNSIDSPWVSKTELRWNQDQWRALVEANDVDSGVIIYIDECRNTKAFFHKLGKELDFPSYFGENLAALGDCLNDGDIVSCSSFCLVIADGDNFLIDDTEDALAGLIDTLDLVGQDWAAGGVWPWQFPPRPFHTVIQADKDDQRYRRLPELLV